MKPKVICVHIGARAHYLLPKALELKGSLTALITDTWILSGFMRSVLKKIPLRLVKSFSGRYSASLPVNKIKSFSINFLFTEISLRLKYKNDWGLILARNFYFQKKAIKIFKKLPSDNSVLGISYTSLEVFKAAKNRGQKTVVFQIDPGYKEEQITADIVEQKKDEYPTTWISAPVEYWADWKKECAIADTIMVNSEWSRLGLIEQGIEAHKIRVLALPFEIQARHIEFKKQYPQLFDQERPLRCLFLGTLTLRKGIHLVLDVAAQVTGLPIEFILVGQSELDSQLLDRPNISYKGVVSRQETDTFYRDADVFLFPTLSDGFGLTQLESMAWKLPVIASKYCGTVVDDQVNGICLQQCTAEDLKTAVIKCLDRGYLQKLSSNCMGTVQKFNMEQFASGLQAMFS